jgi:hypothetical protein
MAFASIGRHIWNRRGALGAFCSHPELRSRGAQRGCARLVCKEDRYGNEPGMENRRPAA